MTKPGCSNPLFNLKRAAIILFMSVVLGQLILSSLSASAEDRIEAGASGVATVGAIWAQDKSDLSSDPDVVFGALSNGVRYVLMKNGEPEDRVSMHLVIQAGSFHEAENEQGLAHFLEHMMFNGTAHYPPGELIKYFQRIGMQFGPDANAHTGFSETVYDVLLPKGDPKSLEQGLLVLKDYAEGALLLQAEIDQERDVILAEKRSRDSADYRTLVAAMHFEYPDARFSNRLPIGDETVIRSVDHDSMKRFYDTWYQPERMILVLVGEFDISVIEPLVEETFGMVTSRRNQAPEPDFGTIIHNGLKAFYHYEPEMGNTTVAVETVQKVEKRTDSKQFRQEEILLDMAERMVKNRLEELTTRSDAPFTSASIHMGRFMQQVEYAEISAECSPESWENSLALIEQTLRKALAYGFTERELSRVKREFISDLDRAVTQASTRDSSDLAGEIIWHINNNRVFISPEQEKALLEPMVNEVTLEKSHTALKEAWAANHRLLLVTGNAAVAESETQSAEKRIESVFKHSTLQAVEKPTDGDMVTFPYLAKPTTKGNISARTEQKDLGIVQVDFENGIRLNFKRTDFEAGLVRVAIAFGGGKSSEPRNKPGLAILSEETVNESGLGRLDKNELAYAFAGTQIATGLDIEEDRFLIRGSCTTKEIELLIQALYAHVLDPGFRPDAFRLALDRIKQQYQSLHRDIAGGMTLEGYRFLAGGDSRFGIPSLSEMEMITLEDVRAWITTALNQYALEINVVGDVDTATVIDYVTGYFGALPKRNATLKNISELLPSFPAGKFLDIKVNTRIPKALAVIAYATDDYWDISRNRRMSVLANIFSEKLRETIREQLGASYSPFAYHRASRAYDGYGTLQAYVYVSPEETARVIRTVKDIANDLAHGGITAEDLELSLNPILTSIKDYRRTNTYWMDRVLTGSARYPQQLDWSRTFESDYAAITISDLRALAESYLINADAACVTIVPQSGE